MNRTFSLPVGNIPFIRKASESERSMVSDLLGFGRP